VSTRSALPDRAISRKMSAVDDSFYFLTLFPSAGSRRAQTQNLSWDGLQGRWSRASLNKLA
jgi:hypothetical protein